MEHVSRIACAISDAAKVPACVSPLHGLRHHHLTALHRAGVDLATARERAGHADLRSTLGYVTPDRGRDRAAAAAALRGLVEGM